MSFINKIKKYFTAKPSSDFWKSAFFTLLFFRYVAPFFLTFITFFQMGLITPEVNITSTIEEVSISLANSFTTIIQRLFETGQSISLNNPIYGKILFYTISSFVWAIWVAMILLMFNLVRYFTSWTYHKILEKWK